MERGGVERRAHQPGSRVGWHGLMRFDAHCGSPLADDDHPPCPGSPLPLPDGPAPGPGWSVVGEPCGER